MTKRVTLLLVAILALSSLPVVNVALAAVSKPPVPSFTVDYEASSDYVPPVYSVNKYTGENTLVQQGYYVENKKRNYHNKKPAVYPIHHGRQPRQPILQYSRQRAF